MVLIIVLLILQSSLLNAQQTREEKLVQLKQRDGVKVTEVEKDIIKIEYPNGKVMYKNIADYQHPVSGIQTTYSPNFDSTIIDLRIIDTTLYYQKYSFWQEVPLGNFRTLLIGDINNNNLPELYGQMKDYTSELSDVVIMEMNSSGSFDSVYSYDNTIIARSIYDIDKDGMVELVLIRNFEDTVTSWLVNNLLAFKKENNNSLAKELSLVFQPRDSNSQQNDNYFGNFDGDEFTDHIFIHPSPPPRINISEYNPSIPNFDSKT